MYSITYNQWDARIATHCVRSSARWRGEVIVGFKLKKRELTTIIGYRSHRKNDEWACGNLLAILITFIFEHHMLRFFYFAVNIQIIRYTSGRHFASLLALRHSDMWPTYRLKYDYVPWLYIIQEPSARPFNWSWSFCTHRLLQKKLCRL